jgi:hypothetical protein
LTLDGDTNEGIVHPRKMQGVGLMMGGLSLGELKSAIGTRKSAPCATETAEESVKTGPGVVIVPVVDPVKPQTTGKPAWMVELAAKKKAKEIADARKFG